MPVDRDKNQSPSHLGLNPFSVMIFCLFFCLFLIFVFCYKETKEKKEEKKGGGHGFIIMTRLEEKKKNQTA